MAEQSALGPRARDIRALLDLLIQEMVDTPQDVRVQAVEGSLSCLFEVYAHREDVRKVIGRKGKTAEALRGLLVNLAGRDDRRYLLEIAEPDAPRPQGGPGARLPLPAEVPPVQRVETLLALTLRQLVDAPSAVRIRPLVGHERIIFEVTAARPDLRKVIGRRGRTANVLRDLFTAIGGRHGLIVTLDVLEPETLASLP